MPRKDRHVVPDPQGGWNVEKPHAERASEHCGTKAESKGGWIVTRRGYKVALGEGKEGIHDKFHEVFETKGEAVDRAKGVSRNQGAEYVVYGRDGKIQSSKNYGIDPCPPKDK
jgi:hypothetical protein